MEEISKEDKNRIIEFIKFNKLDYDYIENDIHKFQIISEDGMSFRFYLNDGKYIVQKYDKKKDISLNPLDIPYDYFSFENLIQILEQIKLYDEGLYKLFYESVLSDAEIGFEEKSYKKDWMDSIQTNVDNTKRKHNNQFNYDFLAYENEYVKPLLKSPYYTLHQISDINSEDQAYIEVTHLYFEIHPVNLAPRNEKYLVKVLANNEEILKEYINYVAYKERGLLKLIDFIKESCVKL